MILDQLYNKMFTDISTDRNLNKQKTDNRRKEVLPKFHIKL